MEYTDLDKKYMNKAIELACKAKGKVYPNPLVGAVIVKNGKIIAKGYHKCPGNKHAEIEAIQSCKEDVNNSTMYVNLEPCTSYGRTPPCTPEIIKAGIKKIYIAMKDPNPINYNQGVNALLKNGIDVEVGLMKKKAMKINEVYNNFINESRPSVSVKVGMSMDGKIATKTGSSQWITSMDSRKQARAIRNRVDAVIIGKNTLIKDNPVLHKDKKEFIKVVVAGEIDFDIKKMNILKNKKSNVFFFTSARSSYMKLRQLVDSGAKVIVLKAVKKSIRLKRVLEILYKQGVHSVLIEGGGSLIASALKEDVIDEYIAYTAPKVIGGKKAISPVDGVGIEKVKQAYQFKFVEIKNVGSDIMFRAIRNRSSD